MSADDDSLTGLDTAQRGSKPRGGAIYHMKVRTGSRARGQSARAACAYIERSAEYGREADKAAELVYTESGHMPSWAEAEAGAVAYWDAADLYERSNGRLYKSIEVALPLALDDAQRRELAVGFAHHLTDAAQLPYTLAIHAGKGANPHCHLMISERTNDGLERSAEDWFKRYNAAAPERGGAQKTTALHPKEWLLETRAAWAERTNEALKEAGLELQIDHRSLEAQGIERVPGIHLGPAAAEMERRGVLTERGDIQAGINQMNEKLRALEKEIDYERQRQRELEPRTIEASREAEAGRRPEAGAAAGRAQRDQRTLAEGREPDDRLAGGPQRAGGTGLADSPAGERGASEDRGAGGAKRLDREDKRGIQSAESVNKEPGRGSNAPGEPPKDVDLGHQPGANERGSDRGAVHRDSGHLRGDDLATGRPSEPARGGAEGNRDNSLDLSPAMGHGDDGRAKDNPAASREQDRREVNAADLATARGQLAAAKARVERPGKLLAAAKAQIERQEERRRQQEERKREQEKKQQRRQDRARRKREEEQGEEWGR